MSVPQNPNRHRALFSLTDKTFCVQFASDLRKLDFDIISTGGTAKALMAGGVSVHDVAEITGFPEGLDGRIKTLHPLIFGGILPLRDKDSHMAFVAEHGIGLFDLVVVNLYEFGKTVASPNATFAECVENIDIGGPSMIRAAAKNYRFCLPVVSPADYGLVTAQIYEYGIDDLSETFRRQMQLKAFSMTFEYDQAIVAYLEAQASK
ncbi:MAG: IMP cyclohydrolase [bacterium]|nr:IMP cyclohydrolase [bacterium]